MTVTFRTDEIAELYRMVSWWCHERSNTFHYIKAAIESRYPEIAEHNKEEFE